MITLRFHLAYLSKPQLTNVMFQPIHIVRLDERSLNIFILTGQDEGIELEIKPDGSIEP